MPPNDFDSFRDRIRLLNATSTSRTSKKSVVRFAAQEPETMAEKVTSLMPVIQEVARSNSNVNIHFWSTFTETSFRDNAGTIITESSIVDSLNTIRQTGDANLAGALQVLGGLVKASGNADAEEHYGALVEYAARPEKRKSVLRTIWKAIEVAVPTVKAAADISATIAGLFK